MTDLSGPWVLSDEDGSYQCDIALPGEDGITALHRAELIPEPYWGRNEDDLRWICERDWTARRTVELPDGAFDLVISGLDTVATVRVNGAKALEAKNAYRSYRVPLAGLTREGTNEIEITFHSVTRAGAAEAAKQPFPLPWSKNCPIPNGNLLRKPHCDFGWDWNIAIAPFGVYGDLRLEPSDAPVITRVETRQDHSGGSVALTVIAHIDGAEGEEATIAFAGQGLTDVVEDGTLSAVFDVDNPALWWPNGLGEQPLHDLSVQVGAVRRDLSIALREIELVTEKDAAGLSFKFRVNGRDVFAKGANWIPADALPGRITEEKTRDLLQSAADAHMNMIRIWGGGRYEPDSFYRACDELGLLVWQDAMFACSLYPSTPDFLAEVDAELREQAARLSHHVALWCGDNELIGALTWYDASREDRDRYLVNYDRLNRAIETAILETDPGANWWPSSPSPGPMNFNDAWHEDGSGDMHFWSVWHEGRDFDHYRDVSPRFCSEFGFQSYTSMDVIRSFAGPKDWNIASPVFENHQKNAGGNARIAETMFRYFRWPAEFDDFVWLSQVQQGQAIKTAVTHWRGLKPHCMGALYWQLNDTWPVCSWASLDYGGGWKVLHHMAKGFFAPVTVVAMPEGERIRLIGVNDGPEPVELTVTAYATALDGAAETLADATMTVGESAVTIHDLPREALGEDKVLTFGWSADNGAKGGDIFAPLPWKTYDLPDPGIEFEAREEGDTWVLTVTAKAMAFFVTAEANHPGRFDRNAVHLGPGHETRLTFTPAHPGVTPKFRLRDLWSATVAT